MLQMHMCTINHVYASSSFNHLTAQFTHTRKHPEAARNRLGEACNKDATISQKGKTFVQAKSR